MAAGQGQPTKSASNVSSAGAAAVVTLAAPGAGQKHIIDWVYGSFDTGTAVTSITIVSGSTTMFSSSIANGSTNRVQSFHFPGGLECGINEAVVITLNLVAAAVASLNVGYR